MVPRDGGRGAGELLSNGYEFQFHKMKRVLNTDVGTVPQLWEYAKCH